MSETLSRSEAERWGVWPVLVCANCNDYIERGEPNIMFGGVSLDDPEVMGPTFHIGILKDECRTVARFYKRRWEARGRKLRRKAK